MDLEGCDDDENDCLILMGFLSTGLRVFTVFCIPE